MEKFILVLGRDIALSLTELISYLKKESITFKILDQQENILLIELDKKININKLGGLIKTAKVVDEEYLENLDLNKDKVTYTTNDPEIKDYLRDKFKKQKIKAFYKSEVKNLNSSSKLDLELIKFKDYIAQVISVSNPNEYKKRDELRPNFDAKKVISIRLAKILINLSEAKREILDPFCGQGTILQESLLMGLNAYGLDLNIQEARENLSWLEKNFSFNAKYKVLQGDSKNLSKYFYDVECCVTEPYLGPYFKKYPKYNEALDVIRDLEKLYIQLFQELNKVVRNKVVILLPIIKTNIKKSLKVNINNILKNTQFKIVKNPMPYSNKGAIVEREIYILDK
ncbi:MAG: DNA methyltransferase [Nanoarchaeota archaeon]